MSMKTKNKSLLQNICKSLAALTLALCLLPSAYAQPGDPKWPTPAPIFGNIGSSAAINPVHDLIYVGSTPTVSDDGSTVFVGSYDGNVYALDALSGAELWRFTTSGPVYSSTAYASTGVVYSGSYDGIVYAIDALTGGELWRYDIGANVGASPAIGGDGSIYVGAQNGYIYALSTEPNPANRLLWSYMLSSSGVMSAAMESGDRLYVGTFDNTFFAMDITAGSSQRVTWSAPFPHVVAGWCLREKQMGKNNLPTYYSP